MFGSKSTVQLTDGPSCASSPKQMVVPVMWQPPPWLLAVRERERHTDSRQTTVTYRDNRVRLANTDKRLSPLVSSA